VRRGELCGHDNTATTYRIQARIEAQFVAVSSRGCHANSFPQLFFRKSMFPLDKAGNALIMWRQVGQSGR
jgi:hypothetical protein